MTSLLRPFLGGGPTHGVGWQSHYHQSGMHDRFREFPHMERYFKFAFVRNPWDWLVSLYASGAARRRFRHHAKSLTALIEWLARTKRPIRPQVSWMKVKGRIALDHVARFENYNAEVGFIFKKLGLKYKSVPHRVNRRCAKYYTEWYTNRTAGIVAKIYKQDIVMFKYKYGA